MIGEPPGRAGVAWKTAKQGAEDGGQGWVALLRRSGSHFAIINCRAVGTATAEGRLAAEPQTSARRRTIGAASPAGDPALFARESAAAWQARRVAQLSVDLTAEPWEAPAGYPRGLTVTVTFAVDGRPLRDLVQDPGSNDWTDPSDEVLPPSRHMWGEPAGGWRHLYGEPDSGYVGLLMCTCATPGCASVIADLVLTETEVAWQRFRAATAANHPPGSFPWLAALSPLTFDRRRYDDALKAAGERAVRLRREADTKIKRR